MPKYDQKSLNDAAHVIDQAAYSTEEQYYPAGGSQYGSWAASMALPAHEQMALLLRREEPNGAADQGWQNLDDFAPESWETFLTKDFFTDFAKVYDAAMHAVAATAEQATYGSLGLLQMAQNAKKVEDANITDIFHSLDKTQNRDGR
jgi:hypothetical protein